MDLTELITIKITKVMKYLFGLIMFVLAITVSSCSGYRGRSNNDSDTLSIEEGEESKSNVSVPRTIEGVTLGMSEQELINVIDPQQYPKELGFHTISDYDREREEILKYWRNIPSDNKEVIVENVKCYKDKVFEIALAIPFGTYDEVLKKFKEKYPLEEKEYSNALFSLLPWWEYSDGKTRIKITLQHDMSLHSSGRQMVVYTDEAYLKLREQEKKEEEAATSSKIDNSIKNL